MTSKGLYRSLAVFSLFSVNFSAYYIQKKCFRILHFYICLVALYKMICLQVFICIFLSVPQSVLYYVIKCSGTAPEV